MNEAQFFELLGRKQLQLEQCLADFRSVLRLLQALQSGEVKLEQVQIDGDRVAVVQIEGSEVEAERN